MLGPGIDALVARMKAAPDLRAHLLASHTMVEDVGRIATSAEVGRLVLNHLIPADDPRFGPADWQTAVAETWAGPVIIGQDGLDIEL
jgi:ribonuclease BN (tRNA processing enzyme)